MHDRHSASGQSSTHRRQSPGASPDHGVACWISIPGRSFLLTVPGEGHRVEDIWVACHQTVKTVVGVQIDHHRSLRRLPVGDVPARRRVWATNDPHSRRFELFNTVEIGDPSIGYVTTFFPDFRRRNRRRSTACGLRRLSRGRHSTSIGQPAHEHCGQANGIIETLLVSRRLVDAAFITNKHGMRRRPWPSAKNAGGDSEVG